MTQAQIRTPNAPAAAKPTTEVAKKAVTAIDYLNADSFRKQLGMALPKFFDTDKFIRSAISEFRLNPALQECSVPSVLGYYMQAANCGLEPASVLGQCYPVPFNNKKTGQRECQFILGYRGMAALARRSGEVMSIDAQIVYEKDEFELVYGLEQKLVHKPLIVGDHGKMIGAYCVVRFRDNSSQYKFMPLSEIEAHKRRSKAGSYGPWVTDYEEMAKKTVFRAMFKWLPITLEAAELVTRDETSATYNPAQAAGQDNPLDSLEIDFTVAQPEQTATEQKQGE